MLNYTDSLSSIAEQAQTTLSNTHSAREKALPLARGVVRLCADSIRATHRKQFDQARELLTQIRSRLDETRTSLAQHQDIYYTGYVSDAQKEFAEASATLAFISGEPLPRPDDLGVEMAPYLNGLAEAASELRRAILDALRRNDIEPCDRWMAAMDEVYSLLVTIDYPEFAEASATLAFISGEPLPRPDDLGVEMAPYLNGLAEAASELRRAILDALRRNDIEPCDRWMAAMDEVYSLLVTIDYPDAVTGGLRRTTDQLRGVLERTRGDLTMALRQHSLEQRLADYQQHVENQ